MKKLSLCMAMILCLFALAACANNDPVYGFDAQSTEADTYPTDPEPIETDVLPDIPNTDTQTTEEQTTEEQTTEEQTTEEQTTEEQTTEEDTHVCTDEVVAEKPVIYLYPETPTECDVRVLLNGELTFTYPAHGALGWQNFVAHPDGTLTFPDGKQYYCLFWEGKTETEYDFSKGFCVAGKDTEAFLEWALAKQGLSPREANEFIIYWLPRMQNNAYNLISFQQKAYTEQAKLNVSPSPDTVIRVFMAWQPLDAPIEIAPQTLTAPIREGFTLVEWGGAEIK